MQKTQSNGQSAGPCGPAAPAEADLPPLGEEDRLALDEFRKKQEVLRGLTLGCIAGSHTGAHVHGPPGVSKTYTINGTLRERRAPWKHHTRITAKPLYLELAKDPGAVHVIDDCEQLLSEKSALTLLRSALGGETVKGRRERRVSYSVAGSRARVMEHYFFGAIIFTSNRPLADEVPEVAAILSRIPSICFAPTDREIRAVMRDAARRGHAGEGGGLTPHECVEVVEHVIETASELKCRLDLRWLGHGFAHYLTHVAGGGKVDWRDMTKFHMMNTLTFFDHPQARPGDAGPADGEEAGQAAVALEIAGTPGLTQAERLRLWEERTGLSRPTYYRRLNAARTRPSA